MKVVTLFPPNYRRINDAFNVRGKPVLFAYGDTIYNPSRMKIPPQLLVHEAVHGRQQESMGTEKWWDSYIRDPGFRLVQEIEAHRAEYRDVCERGQRSYEALEAIATRLASPLYGGLISIYDARATISTPSNLTTDTAWSGSRAENAI